MAKNRSGGGSGRLLLGFMLGVLVTVGGGFAYLHFGKLRVMPKSLSSEKRVANVPSHPQRAVPKESPANTVMPPFGASEDAFEGGAHVYRAECAKCHGVPGRDAAFGRTMNPPAGQLWKNTRNGGTGVNAGGRPGDIYEKVANGVRSTGMPAYKHVLTDTQLWQVSLLLASADKELPGPVMRLLSSP